MTDLVAFRLIHLADVISRAATAVFEARFNLNNSELRALIVLREEQPLTSAELSRRGRIDKAWISRSIDRLEKRRLVNREAHPTDSRMTLISLTTQGVELMTELTPIATQRQKRLLSGLSPNEAFRVIEILERNAQDLLSNP
ncbi:MarR family transcriptional regulator [Roseiarcaceae bacterium H3SJ34-1]|uniref:MarR family winged helix-turn-helix transcriptional regulator n=1 Tax=Terripilifer ovatus TaxID=3032367 RepID=UPI003AB975F6|nr:MarR family transcriptional regulator [Roseiarcaceae bacterium H3SJ34-1]